MLCVVTASPEAPQEACWLPPAAAPRTARVGTVLSGGPLVCRFKPAARLTRSGAERGFTPAPVYWGRAEPRQVPSPRGLTRRSSPCALSQPCVLECTSLVPLILSPASPQKQLL